MSQKYRISYNLSTPLRFLGFTIDEAAMTLAALFSFFFCDNKLLGGLLSVFFGLGVWILKRLKKRAENFNLKSFVWWHLGFSQGKTTLPLSQTRRIG